jgi:hypothetical protein
LRRQSRATPSAIPNSKQRSSDQDVGQLAQQVDGVLRGLELPRAQHDEVGRARGDRGRQPPAHPELLRHRLQQPLQMQRDHALAGRDVRATTVEHLQQVDLGRAIRVGPQPLDARVLERPERGAVGELAQPARGRAGERLQPGRERRADLSLDVDVGVELVDQERRELLADHGPLQQLGAGLRPVVGVQDLAVRPHGEDPAEGEHRCHHHENTCDAPATHGARLRAGRPPAHRPDRVIRPQSSGCCER